MTGSRVCLQGAINQPVLTTQAVTFHPPQETSLRTCPRRQEDNKSHERSWVPTLAQASYLTVATCWEEARWRGGGTTQRKGWQEARGWTSRYILLPHPF